MGAVGAAVLSATYGKFNISNLKDSLIKTLEISTLILVLVVASNFFGSVFSRLGTPTTVITELLLSLDMPPMALLLIIMDVIFLLGWPFGVGSNSILRSMK